MKLLRRAGFLSLVLVFLLSFVPVGLGEPPPIDHLTSMKWVTPNRDTTIPVPGAEYVMVKLTNHGGQGLGVNYVIWTPEAVDHTALLNAIWEYEGLVTKPGVKGYKDYGTPTPFLDKTAPVAWIVGDETYHGFSVTGGNVKFDKKFDWAMFIYGGFSAEPPPPPPPPPEKESKIEIYKTASPNTLPEPGGEFTYTYKIKNTGTKTLTLTSIVDNLLGDISLPEDKVLEAGESVIVVKTVTYNKVGVYENKVTVTAIDNCEKEVTDTAEENVEVTDILPLIYVYKTPNPFVLPEPGGLFTYTYVITNSGEETVTIVGAEDDKLGTLLIGGMILGPGESSPPITKWATYTEPGTYGNTVMVVAKDDEGNQVQALAETAVVVRNVKPVISITKTATPLTRVEPGGKFSYTYVVKNTGTIDVFLTSVFDDVFGNLLDKDVFLKPGASYTLTAMITYKVSGKYPNTVIATAEDRQGEETSAKATATVTVTEKEQPEETTETVVPTETVPPVKTLPFTGGDAIFLVLIAAGCAATGFALRRFAN